MVNKKQTILITGGARRIGRALAEDFARQDWQVIVHYHTSQADAQALQKHIGDSCQIIMADLSNEEQTQNLIPTIVERWGPVDCLINNAATFKPDDFLTSTRQDWDFHLETNLRAPFILCQQFARQPNLYTSPAIINILDHTLWNLTQRFMTYGLSKFALQEATQMMAIALAPKIRVNAIGLGPTLINSRQSEAHFSKLCKNTPLERGPQLDEITQAAHFIINSSSMTGQIIALDGGQHLKWISINKIMDNNGEKL